MDCDSPLELTRQRDLPHGFEPLDLGGSNRTWLLPDVVSPANMHPRIIRRACDYSDSKLIALRVSRSFAATASSRSNVSRRTTYGVSGALRTLSFEYSRDVKMVSISTGFRSIFMRTSFEIQWDEYCFPYSNQQQARYSRLQHNISQTEVRLRAPRAQCSQSLTITFFNASSIQNLSRSLRVNHRSRRARASLCRALVIRNTE